MIITNDILTFEPADIAQLSAELQTALDAYSAPTPVEVLLSRIVNDAFLRAGAHRTYTRLNAVKNALKTATPEEKTVAEDFLAQAESTLKL